MTYDTILDELEDYCLRSGLKQSTVCVRALNDSRYVARHRRRLEALDRDAEKIRAYIAANPAPSDDTLPSTASSVTENPPSQVSRLSRDA